MHMSKQVNRLVIRLADQVAAVPRAKYTWSVMHSHGVFEQRDTPAGIAGHIAAPRPAFCYVARGFHLSRSNAIVYVRCRCYCDLTAG